ncbi:hypothetical protein KC878_01485 [Candidatus Saccharibacteria bacterium]|nr:hypothetical protein [Candidatus Saccharibacteria bacterium]MCB9821198.1 hypothetical protein [Candidatus Nomurabacteria bacterium]
MSARSRHTPTLSGRLDMVFPNDPMSEARSSGRMVVQEFTWGDALSKVVEQLDISVADALKMLGISLETVQNSGVIKLTDGAYAEYQEDRVDELARTIATQIQPEIERIGLRFEELKAGWRVEEDRLDSYQKLAEMLLNYASETDNLHEDLNSQARHFPPRTALRYAIYELRDFNDDLQARLRDMAGRLEKSAHLLSLADLATGVLEAGLSSSYGQLITSRALASTIEAILQGHRYDVSRVLVDRLLVGDTQLDVFRRQLRTEAYEYCLAEARDRWQQVAEVVFLAEDPYYLRVKNGQEQ